MNPFSFFSPCPDPDDVVNQDADIGRVKDPSRRPFRPTCLLLLMSSFIIPYLLELLHLHVPTCFRAWHDGYCMATCHGRLKWTRVCQRLEGAGASKFRRSFWPELVKVRCRLRGAGDNTTMTRVPLSLPAPLLIARPHRTFARRSPARPAPPELQQNRHAWGLIPARVRTTAWPASESTGSSWQTR